MTVTNSRTNASDPIEQDLLVAFADALYAAGGGAGGKAMDLEATRFLIEHFREGFRQALEEFPGRWHEHRITVLQVATRLGEEAARLASNSPSIERAHVAEAAELVRDDPRCPRTPQQGRYCP